MKKLLPTLLLGLCATATIAQSNTVTGTITDCHGNPVSGHPVYISTTDSVAMDSTFVPLSYYTYTDVYGIYSYDVPYSSGSQGITVSTYDNYSPWTYFYNSYLATSSGNTFPYNFTLSCDPDSIHTTIYGHIYDCTGSPMTNQPVWGSSDSTAGSTPAHWSGYTYTDPVNGFYSFDVAYSAAVTLPFPVVISTANPYPHPGYTYDTVYVYDTTSIFQEIYTSCPPLPCEVSFFSWYDSTGTSGNDTVYLFVNYSSATPAAASFAWDYGDSSTGTGAYTTHVYSVDGTYTVCVSVDNPVDSCNTTYCHDIDFTTLERSSGFVLKTYLGTTTGIREPAKQENTFSVYPNPADNLLNVQSSAGIKTAKIFDMSGRQVMQVNAAGVQSKMSLDISNLENGSYILSLFNENNELLHTHTVLKH